MVIIIVIIVVGECIVYKVCELFRLYRVIIIYNIMTSLAFCSFYEFFIFLFRLFNHLVHHSFRGYCWCMHAKGDDKDVSLYRVPSSVLMTQVLRSGLHLLENDFGSGFCTCVVGVVC